MSHSINLDCDAEACSHLLKQYKGRVIGLTNFDPENPHHHTLLGLAINAVRPAAGQVHLQLTAETSSGNQTNQN